MRNRKTGLGLFTCTATIVGSMIGSAIFSLSGLTMLNAGPSAIISWIIAAVIMMFYGLICSELATRYPQSGGIYNFPAKAFHNPLPGWMSNWGSMLANIVAIAFAAIYFGIYLGAGFGLDAKYQVPIAVLSITLCVVLNLLDFSKLGKFNSVLVAGLLATMLIYVITAFSSDTFTYSNMIPLFTQGLNGRFAFLSCVPTAMLGYGNIVSMTYLVSEVRKPEKTIPKSVLFAMITVSLMYCLMIVATLGNITISFLKNNPGMTYIPMYAACFTSLSSFEFLSKIISVAAVLALFTTNLILISITCSSLKAAKNDGILPDVFGNSSFNALLTGFLSAFLSCFPSFVEEIVNYGALFAAVTVIINIVSLLKSRTDRTIDTQKLFSAPGGNTVPVLLIFVIILCYIPDIVSGWQIWVYTAISYLAGFFIYRIRKVGL